MVSNVLKGHSSLGHYSSAGLTTSIKTCHCINHPNLGSPSEVHLHFLVQKSIVAPCDLSIKPTFLTLIFIKWKWKLLSHVWLFVTPWTNSPGQNTRVGSPSLLQGIFPTQGSKPGLLHCRWILYQLSHQGNPRILERVAFPFSSRSSWPRNQTGVSCLAGRFFTELWGKQGLATLQFTFPVCFSILACPSVQPGGSPSSVHNKHCAFLLQGPPPTLSPTCFFF